MSLLDRLPGVRNRLERFGVPELRAVRRRVEELEEAMAEHRPLTRSLARQIDDLERDVGRFIQTRTGRSR